MATHERTVTQSISLSETPAQARETLGAVAQAIILSQGPGTVYERTVSQSVTLSQGMWPTQAGDLDQSVALSGVVTGSNAGQPVEQSITLSQLIGVEVAWNLTLAQSFSLSDNTRAYKIPWVEVGTTGTPTTFTIDAPLNREVGHSISLSEVITGEIGP